MVRVTISKIFQYRVVSYVDVGHGDLRAGVGYMGSRNMRIASNYTSVLATNITKARPVDENDDYLMSVVPPQVTVFPGDRVRVRFSAEYISRKMLKSFNRPMCMQPPGFGMTAIRRPCCTGTVGPTGIQWDLTVGPTGNRHRLLPISPIHSRAYHT